MKEITRFVGSIAYTGLFPIAPATFSTFVIALVLGLWGPGPMALAILLIVSLLLSVPVATRMERDWGKDPSSCTIDELAGFVLALQGRDLGAPGAWTLLVIAFFLFRFFDILKIWPGRRLESLPAGWGIVADDLMAGLYSGLVLLALAPWLH